MVHVFGRLLYSTALLASLVSAHAWRRSVWLCTSIIICSYCSLRFRVTRKQSLGTGQHVPSVTLIPTSTAHKKLATGLYCSPSVSSDFLSRTNGEQFRADGTTDTTPIWTIAERGFAGLVAGSRLGTNKPLLTMCPHLNGVARRPRCYPHLASHRWCGVRR